MGIREILMTSAIPLLVATTANASTYTLDLNNSSVQVTMSGACQFTTACANVSASFGSGASGVNWTPTSQSETLAIADFIDWTVTGGLIHSYTVAVSLAFTSPNPAFGTGSGAGDAGHTPGIAASASDGSLSWDASSGIGFADGSTLFADFDNLDGFGLVSDGDIIGFSSGVEFSLDFDNGQIAPSVVPLPASIPLLIAGLAGLGVVGRRRKSI